MKRILLLLVMACAMVSIVDAATATSYTASDSPGSAPDGNTGTVDVWTVTGDGGAGRSFMANQDGNTNVWAIWDINGGAGTYAMHTFAGGALMVGQSVSIDWTHNININNGTSIGIRLLDGSNTEAALVFQGGKLVYSRFDTGTGVYADTAKYYDRYDFYQVVFTLTGTNSYTMSVSEGSIADNPTGLGNNADDNNPAAGNVVDLWTGSFTGSAITGIQVYTEGGNSSDQWFDNLTISSDGMKYPHDPVPANGASDVAIENITLSWQAGTDPNGTLPGLKGYYVYFGEESDTLYQVNTTMLPAETTTYNMGTKATDTTYYWQVEEAMDNGLGGSYAAGDPNNVMGSIWSFTTIISVPVITTQPQPALAAIGDSAEFTIGVSSITTPTFKWYYSTDPNNNTPADDVLRSTDQTFNIPTVGSSDEGYYYCVVNNDSGVAVTSLTARLEIKKLIAWYALEGDVTDSENDYDGTVIETDPNSPSTAYVTGVIGQAISLDGVGNAVSIPRSIQDSFTIELWVKTATTGGTGGWYNGKGLVDGEVAGNQNDFGTVLYGNNFGFGIGNPDTTISSTSVINDDQWHYCVATRDHITGQMKVYVDGKEEASITGPVGTKNTPEALRIGSLQAAINYLAGQIDEVKLYNYPLAELTVAAQYNTVTGESVCVLSQRPNAAFDLDGNCIVNIADFAIFASNWLRCGLYPQSDCTN